jgi:orotidine-5'-phosphate decarboxylase
MNPYSIIFSADFVSETTSDFCKSIEKVSPFIDGVKIHLSSLIYFGKDLLFVLSECLRDKSLILDLKIGDIGFKKGNKFEGSNAKILQSVNSMVRHYHDVYVTIHGFPGPVSVEECVDVAHSLGLKVLLIPYMSHKGAEVFYNFKFGNSKDDKKIFKKYNMDLNFIHPLTASESILYLGEQLGVDGFIGPSNNLEVIHSYRRFSTRLIASPGFGRQSNGLPINEQFYNWSKEVGPNSAAIIGSFIYNDKHPEEVASYLMKMRDAFVDDIIPESTWEVEGKTQRSVLNWRETDKWVIEDGK